MEDALLLNSPKLEALRQAIEAGNLTAFETFWQEIRQKGTPLVESISGDEKHFSVPFLWRAADDTQTIAVVSNLSGKMAASEPMARLASTDLWYKTYRLPNAEQRS